MIFYAEDVCLKTCWEDDEYGLQFQSKSDYGGWMVENGFFMDRREVIRLAEDIRQWAKENPE